jgi:hypothetical protein
MATKPNPIEQRQHQSRSGFTLGPSSATFGIAERVIIAALTGLTR